MPLASDRPRDLRELFQEYTNECEYVECLSPETIRGYRNVFQLFLKIMPKVSTTESLTNRTLNEFFKLINTRIRIVGKDTPVSGVKKSTIKTQYGKLNVFFRWLYKNGYIMENPLKDIKSPRVSYTDFRRLEDTDINRIYSAITLHSDNKFIFRRDLMMVSLLLFCGLRKGELSGLQVRDIDIAKKEITIRAETSKSKKTRVLRIHDTLLPQIKDYFTERKIRNLRTEYLIASSKEDRGLTHEGLKHWVKSVIKKSGVKFHLHRFRHTFACKLDEGGVSAFRIQKLLGHSSIMMTMKYVRSLKTEDMGEDINSLVV